MYELCIVCYLWGGQVAYVSACLLALILHVFACFLHFPGPRSLGLQLLGAFFCILIKF